MGTARKGAAGQPAAKPTPKPAEVPGEVTADAMAARLDEQLMDALTNGVPLIGFDGRPVVDKAGKVMTKRAGAAYLEIARKRLKELRAERPTSPEDQLLAEARARFGGPAEDRLKGYERALESARAANQAPGESEDGEDDDGDGDEHKEGGQ